MLEGYPHISLPTLGTQYELNSLISINTIGRKSSQVSQLSSAGAGDKHDVAGDVFDGRVSRFIDADVSNSLHIDESYKDDPRNFTFQSILDQTSLDQTNEEVNPPRAEPEVFTSRPISRLESVSSCEESLAAPAVELTPPSPSLSADKQRPKSDNFEVPPWIPIKVKYKA